MRKTSLVIGAALALAACSSDAEQVENSIRETLGNEATVEQVEMNQQSDGNMIGYAVVRDKEGRRSSMNCDAHPQSGDKYAWKCAPRIDAETEKDISDTMRARLAGSGEVLEMTMKRKDDDNHMAGKARVKTPDGAEHVLNCTAARQENGQFLPNCEEVAVFHHDG